MKDRSDSILRTPQAEYLDRLLPALDPLLREMEEAAEVDGVPISDPEVGLLLQMLVQATGARRVLEVGSAIGYGTLWMARGGEQTVVTAVERDPERQALAKRFLARAEVEERVEFVTGDALDILRTLEPPYDLVYLDADKKDYRRLLDFSLQLLRVGGVVAIDNLLWKGQVADPPEDVDEEDPQVESLRAFNGYFAMHPQLDSLVLPFGDGLGLGVKKKPLITDIGGPY